MLIITALLTLLLLAALFASGNSWSNVLSTSRNDLVFDGRNRAYGAYVIRQEHHRVMVIAFLAAIGSVGVALILPKLLSTAGDGVLVAPPDNGVDVNVMDVYDPPASTLDPPATAPRPKGPLEMVLPVATDSVITAPKDTATGPVDPGPKGPVGPVGPKDPETGKPGGGGTDTNTIFEGWAADAAPEYPGGLEALYADLQRIVRYPDIDVDAQREGRVTVGFVVAEDGSVTDVVVMRGVSPTMDAEALRVVRKLKRWKPGQFKGRDVKVRYTLPIAFKLARQ